MNARDLTEHLADLLRREHHAMADFLLALADLDRERGWMELGHPSLFSFQGLTPSEVGRDPRGGEATGLLTIRHIACVVRARRR